MSKSVKIVSLGCSKNTVDSEKLYGQLQFAGFKTDFKKSGGKTDIVIVNTCGFINDAKEESINTILELVEAKKRGEIGNLYVMGCLSERYREQLEKAIPEVDQYFGVNRLGDILSYLKYDYNKVPDPGRILMGPPHYAYLKVSEGCNRRCAFCAIPGIRGRYISTPLEDVVKEAKILCDGGVKELILIAQDLSYYGTDLFGKPMLADLCRKILDSTDVEWLRLHYLYPGSFGDDLLHLIKSHSRICNYIDIPIQHISDQVLRAMKRGHNEKSTRLLLRSIREQIPDAAIRTSMITGYPAESENDFLMLLEFIKEFRFERLGVFIYSHEENTYAHSRFSDSVPSKVKRERADMIMAAQQEIALQKNMSMVGKEMYVIVDREEDGNYIARSEFDSPEIDQEILINAGEDMVKVGTISKVLITGASEFDLEAVLIK